MTLEERLRALVEVCEHHDFRDLALRLVEIKTRLDYDKVHLVILGEFNRGKTTLVNALIGQALLPMDIVPTTAAIWTIEEGEHLSVQLIRKDGEHEELDPAPDVLARLSAEGDLADEDVRFVKVCVPELGVAEDVVLIDTPGVNDINEQRAEITYGFLGSADAAVFLLNAATPATRSEAEFLNGQVLDASLDKIVFLLNRTSSIDEDEVEESFEAAKERLEGVLEREVTMVACDALKILEAAAAGDTAEMDRWGWSAIRAALDGVLAEARSREKREALASTRVQVLAGVALERLQGKEKMAQLEAGELEQAAQDFRTEVEASSSRFERLMEYVAEHGRERLKLMLAQSLRHSAEEFREANTVMVSTMKTGFEDFATKRFPHELQVFIKRWFDARQADIERFIAEFSGHVAQEYARHFGYTLDYQNLALSGDKVGGMEVGAQIDSEELKEMSDYVTMALPGASLVTAYFLVGGPFAILALPAGMMLGKALKDRKSKAVQEKLLAELPAVIDTALDSALNQLNESIDRWFGGYAEALKEQFVAGAAMKEGELRKMLTSGDRAAREELRATIEQDLASMKKLLDEGGA